MASNGALKSTAVICIILVLFAGNLLMAAADRRVLYDPCTKFSSDRNVITECNICLERAGDGCSLAFNPGGCYEYLAKGCLGLS